MSNNEFIAAKDLPTTEAEEVDVLCVEGGELKRKPGARLGGGGGSAEYDIVLEGVYDYVSGTSQEATTWTLVRGNPEAARDKILAGQVVHALAKVTKPNRHQVCMCESITVGYMGYDYDGHLVMMFEYDGNDNSCYIHLPSGRISNQPVDVA